MKRTSMLWLLFVLVVVYWVLLVGAVGCSVETPKTPEKTAEQIEQEQQAAEKLERIAVQAEVVARIHYIKDQHTGLCFAYFYEPGGPVLACVPCERVEAFLPQ